MILLPAVLVATQFFPNNTGVIVLYIGAGTNLGAVLFTIIFNNLDDAVGSAWRDRIMGFSTIPFFAFILYFLQPPKQHRIPSTRKLRLRDVYPKFSSVKNPALLYMALSKSLCFFSSWSVQSFLLISQLILLQGLHSVGMQNSRIHQDERLHVVIGRNTLRSRRDIWSESCLPPVIHRSDHPRQVKEYVCCLAKTSSLGLKRYSAMGDLANMRNHLEVRQVDALTILAEVLLDL